MAIGFPEQRYNGYYQVIEDEVANSTTTIHFQHTNKTSCIWKTPETKLWLLGKCEHISRDKGYAYLSRRCGHTPKLSRTLQDELSFWRDDTTDQIISGKIEKCK